MTVTHEVREVRVPLRRPLWQRVLLFWRKPRVVVMTVEGEVRTNPFWRPDSTKPWPADWRFPPAEMDPGNGPGA